MIAPAHERRRQTAPGQQGRGFSMLSLSTLFQRPPELTAKTNHQRLTYLNN